MVRDLQRNHPTAARDVMRTTRVRSKVERSRACAPLTKTQVWDSGFFAHALFVPKTQNVMGFSGSVNGTTKNPGFLDFGFCQCKWAYSCKIEISHIILQNHCLVIYKQMEPFHDENTLIFPSCSENGQFWKFMANLWLYTCGKGLTPVRP